MRFNGLKKRGILAQSVIEYALLTAIAVVALLIGTNFASKLKTNAFERHFQSAGYWTGATSLPKR